MAVFMQHHMIWLLICPFLLQGLAAFRVVCVYTNWSQYRPDIGKFVPEDVDPTLCTHLVYVYAKLKGNKLIASEWNDEGSAWSEGMFQRVQNLKQLNPELKTLLGVGGWMMGSKDFSRMAARLASRRMFATSTVKFLRERDFDGLTIDWQYPTKRGGKPYDKKNFSLLLKELNKAFQDESKRSQLPPLLLTIGVAGGREIIDSAYEFDNITRYADFINVMAYDLHGPWDNYTGHPSQLYARQEEFGPATEINVDAVMRHWISNIPDRSKLVLGVSTYGRSFTLRKQRHNEYGVPSTGPGIAGEYTKQPGMLAYYERCSQYADATRVWDDHSKVAYWYRGDQWLAGEDIESIKAKVRWVKQHRTGGITIQALDTDDFYNTCSVGPYPLLTALNDEISAPFVPITTTTALYYETSTDSIRKLKTTTVNKSKRISTRSPLTSKIPRKKIVQTNNNNIKNKTKDNAKLNLKKQVNTNKKNNGTRKITVKKQAPTKRIMTRNDNPNNKKDITNIPRNGNRIIVRKKNAKPNRSQNIKSTETNSNSKPHINDGKKKELVEAAGVISKKSENKTKNMNSKNNNMTRVENIEPNNSNQSESKGKKNSIQKENDLKTVVNAKKQTAKTQSVKTKQPKEPSNKATKKKPQSRRRRKLTKKQMEILRRRRNRQRQARLKKKNDEAKKKQ